MSNIIPIDQVRVMAKSASASKLFSAKAEEQIFTLMLVAQSEGIHPIKALMSYDIINGQPALKSSEALARYMDAGGKIEWIKSDKESAKARFTHPSSGSFEYEYTVEDATDAGLINKDNYKKNRKAMLRARCTSAGNRKNYPRCLNNMYLAEEVQDFEPVEIDEPKSEIIEGEISQELDIKELKRTLTRRLKVDYNYNDAMIKEFADLFDISENVENLSKMVEDNEYLLKCIEQFEKENN